MWWSWWTAATAAIVASNLVMTVVLARLILKAQNAAARAEVSAQRAATARRLAFDSANEAANTAGAAHTYKRMVDDLLRRRGDVGPAD